MPEWQPEVIERPPIVIEFMLNCFFSHSPEVNLGRDRWESYAGKTTRKWLWIQGLIDDDNMPTDRGKAWVKAICKTPLPPPPADTKMEGKND